MNDIASAPLTLTIVIATCAVTIVSFRSFSLYNRLLLNIDAVLGRRGEWWRMLTCGLVHADYMHLAFNMFSLFMFGIWFEHVISSWRFGMVYALGVLAGSFASIIVHRGAPSYMAVGASAGVSAVVGAATVVYPDLPMMLIMIPFPMPAWVFGCLYIVYSVMFASRGVDNVGHEAHLGGMLAGMTLIAAFYPGIAIDHAFAIIAMLGAGGLAYAWRQRRFLR